MDDKRHGRDDQYGNRKYFPASSTRWGPRLTKGVAHATHPNDICRELIKIVYFDPVSTALLTGNVDKLDRNRHFKHVPMTKQAIPSWVA